LLKVLAERYSKIKQSIAFYPILIILGFIVASILILFMEASPLGDSIKNHYPFMIVADAATARVIQGTLIGGIISITVFSFSMVMVVMNQTASYFSQKLPQNFIEEMPPQIFLGINVGSIIYCLIILYRVYEKDGIQDIPSLGILFTIFLGIVNILLFVYFINHIAKSIELYTIVNKIHKKTAKEIDTQKVPDKQKYKTYQDAQKVIEANRWHIYEAKQSGFFQDVNKEDLVKLACRENMLIRLNVTFGSYLVKGTPLFSLTKHFTDSSILDDIYSAMDYFVEEKIEQNLFYGFRQLSEIAVKALSPGINDPATAIFCLEYLKDLFARKMDQHQNNFIYDSMNELRLITQPVDYEKLFYMVLGPIRLYGKSDVSVMMHLLDLLKILAYLDRREKQYQNILVEHLNMILFDAEKSIENNGDRRILKHKLLELLAIEGYFEVNSAILKTE
jgi:uncharacterized membrane protein